ncbi:hypothetical protein D9M72_609880 [compost metagenome]
MAEDFRKDPLQLFALVRMIARGFRRRPVFKHYPERLILKSRIQLQEPVEPGEPHRLRGVFVTSVAHQRDVLGHHFAQHAAEWPGLV